MRRPGGWTLVLIAAGFGLVLTIAIALWWRSDADLRAADDHARSLGLPTTWAELGLKASPHLAEWKRLMQLAEAVQSYIETVDYDSRSWNGPRIGEPIPEDVRKHHAALDQREVVEILGIIDGLPDGTVVEITEFAFDTRLPDISKCRSLTRWFVERVGIADRGLIDNELQRMARIITAGESTLLIGQLVRISEAALWCSAACQRLPEASEQQRLAMADQARRIAICLRSEWPRIWNTESLTLRTSIGKVKAQDLSMIVGITGASHGDWRDDALKLALPSIIRLGRRSVIESSNDWAALVARNPPTLELLTAHQTEMAHLQSRPWSPGTILCRYLQSARDMLVHSQTKALLHLDLLAAELTGTPWPIDPMDPAGTRLRPIVRDGRSIGAYSLGKNSADDGGSIRDDFCFALHARLGKTLAADPP